MQLTNLALTIWLYKLLYVYMYDVKF